MLGNFSKLILIFCVILFVGCTSQQDKLAKEIDSKVIDAQRAIGKLETQLTNGTIQNAKLLGLYASHLKKQKPDFSEIIDTLAMEGTTYGLTFKNLQQRYSQVKLDAANAAKGTLSAAENTYDELDSIIKGSNVNNYNMMLTDPINVIADMSDGQLARVESMSKEASLAANKSDDFGNGSQLVGNPNYGSWQTNSSGTSVWTWVAMYAMFNSMNRSPIYYDRWSRGRDYSYHGSVGRHHYNSPKQKATETKINKNYSDKFARQGKKFQSPYAKNKVTTAKVSQQRQSIERASTSRNSRGSASSRRASTRTSRSSSRGK